MSGVTAANSATPATPSQSAVSRKLLRMDAPFVTGVPPFFFTRSLFYCCAPIMTVLLLIGGFVALTFL